MALLLEYLTLKQMAQRNLLICRHGKVEGGGGERCQLRCSHASTAGYKLIVGQMLVPSLDRQ